MHQHFSTSALHVHITCTLLHQIPQCMPHTTLRRSALSTASNSALQPIAVGSRWRQNDRDESRFARTCFLLVHKKTMLRISCAPCPCSAELNYQRRQAITQFHAEIDFLLCLPLPMPQVLPVASCSSHPGIQPAESLNVAKRSLSPNKLDSLPTSA
jgi:hypothetical protein